ncbi:MAG: hypothetical protein IID08_07530 [Candidatus Hydrogenedentes bacterium]|nr:hypothetical protein [Candidatus Hydrogenedentota bacterium]
MHKKLKIKIQFSNPTPEAVVQSDDPELDELELVEQDSRPGFYKDGIGHWRADRREFPERRKMSAPKSVGASRKRVRRRVDRQALRFLRGIDD